MSRRRDTSTCCFWICLVSLLVLTVIPTSKGQVMGRSGQFIDCQKYVFAPACRGIAAKRSEYTAPQRPLYPHSEMGPEDIETWNWELKNINRNANRKKNQNMRMSPMTFEDFLAERKRLF